MTFQEQQPKYGVFQEQSQNQKNSRTIQEIQGIQERVATLKLDFQVSISNFVIWGRACSIDAALWPNFVNRLSLYKEMCLMSPSCSNILSNSSVWVTLLPAFS